MTDTTPTMVFFPCHRALAGAARLPEAAGTHRGAPA